MSTCNDDVVVKANKSVAQLDPLPPVSSTTQPTWRKRKVTMPDGDNAHKKGRPGMSITISKCQLQDKSPEILKEKAARKTFRSAIIYNLKMVKLIKAFNGLKIDLDSKYCAQLDPLPPVSSTTQPTRRKRKLTMPDGDNAHKKGKPGTTVDSHREARPLNQTSLFKPTVMSAVPQSPVKTSRSAISDNLKMDQLIKAFNGLKIDLDSKYCAQLDPLPIVSSTTQPTSRKRKLTMPDGDIAHKRSKPGMSISTSECQFQAQ
ncbi:hypothetical protein DPEC_G00196650 [Dallia pectoralis]|uniref:Uncharacterized protein n=1 Tax=Dallia pectoralis TaxID=75939 RepID=A0ACC2G7E4_DALPE|nr:hypothetical protein DPEC_G00196650 [Dallia pectoralis]